MRRIGAVLTLLLSTGTAPHAGEFRTAGRTFVVPEGLEIELVAASPLVDRPITADVDEKGRLYVADSSGSNDKVAVQLVERPHRIVRLEDTDGDGRYDKSTVFADKMMFPEGTMWFEGSLYVSAPPSIWKLTDTDDDGVADQRVEWFQGKTLTGCANDLHGPYRGPDGMIYWAKGAFAEQTYPRPGRSPFVTRASHLFRAKPDGTGIEPVMTGGMDNPVDVAFSPAGERFFTTTFLVNPQGGQRDGIIHAIYGGVYGKIHNVIDGHPRTRPEMMPTLVHLGPAAPCGLHRYESNVLGDKYRNNLFACQFNLRKVSRHALIPDGGSFRTEDSDLVSSPDQDFHPTDVIEDFDGSVLVCDTGGWYKLCCPTSQLGKPDVLGGVYRIKPKWLAAKHDARTLLAGLEKADAAGLVAKLDDKNAAVRRRAADLLAKRPDALPALAAADSPEARLAAVWIASRIGGAEASAFARKGLRDKDAAVRQAACHVAAVHRDAAALPLLLDVLRSDDVAVRRAAAEAVGRIGDKSAVPAILSAVGTGRDRTLEHSLTYALIEIGDKTAVRPALASDNLATRRAALVALDQLDDDFVSAKAVARNFASRDKTLREAAGWIASRHPAWGDDLAGVLASQLSTIGQDEANDLVDLIGRFAERAPIQRMLAERLRSREGTEPAKDGAYRPSRAQIGALHAMRRTTLKTIPDDWALAVAGLLDVRDPVLRMEAIETVRSWPALGGEPGKALAQRLLDIGMDKDLPAATRMLAVAAVPGGLRNVGPELLAFLRDRLSADLPVSDRLVAADALAKAKLDRDGLLALAEMLKTAGPLEVDKLLSAFDASKDEAVGAALVAALSGAKSRSSLRADALKTRVAKFGPKVESAAKPLLDSLNLDAAKQKDKLETMLGQMKDGDVRRGQLVFNGSKGACRTCHSSGYVGGKVGPDLTRVGGTRTERDLLEAILFPSVSFVRSYEPVVIETRDGKIVGGIVKQEGSNEVVLMVNATEEVRIPRASIEEMRPGDVSVMPAGLDQQLTVQELADLVAFLKNSK